MKRMNRKFKLYPIKSCPYFETLSRDFNSSNVGIDDFLRQKCLLYEDEHRLNTFVLVDSENNKMVGFFSSTLGLLNQKVKKDDGFEVESLPYINLAYFAIDQTYQRQGIGRALMMEFFSMCMTIAMYTGVPLIYLESVDESVNFYKKLGYSLQDERKTPELYRKYNNDTSKINFPMLRKISDLVNNGHMPYSKNMMPINL